MIQNKIYDFLKANKLTDKDQQTFLKEYSDSAKAKELYGFFQANQLTDKDFNSFYDTYLKKKEPLEPLSPDGGKAGTSEAQLGLKPAKIQPIIFKEPSVGEDTVLARKLAKEQRAAAEGTGVRLPAAPKVVAEERAAERALAPKIEKPTETEGQSWLSNTVSALDRGFYKNLIGNPVKGLATVIQYGTEAMTGGRVKEGPVSDALMRFGNWFNNAIDEVAPQDPEFKNSLSDQFAQALGQVGSVVLTGGFGAGGRGAAIAEQVIPKTGKLASVAAATKAGGKELVSQMASPAAISAGLTMGQSEFERAKQAGASDDQAFEAFYKNAAVGSILEKIPVMQFFKRLNNSTQGGVVNYLKTKGVAGLTGGTEEMTTEVLQQLYANKTAQDIYNVNQDIFEGLTESGGIGFGVGFLLNAMGARAKVLRNEGKEAEAKVVEDQAKEFESRASKGAAEPEVPPTPPPAAAPVVTEEVKAEEVVTPAVPQTEETLNKYLSTFKRRLAERKKELKEQGVTDVEADQQVKNIEAKIENTQESISKLGEVPPVAEEVRITQPAPQVPVTPETQKESIQNITKKEELDISSDQLDRLYDEVVKGGGKIEDSQIRKILNVGYLKAIRIAEDINDLGFGEVAPEAAPELPAAPVEALKDVESTTKALSGFRWDNPKVEKITELSPNIYAEFEGIAEDYHQFKKEGSNPEFVKAVEDLLVGEVAPRIAPEVPAAPIQELKEGQQVPKEAEVSEDLYYAYYKEGLPTYNIDEFRKNPDILKSDEAYHSIKYPNSFVGLYTDRSLIALENKITPESIKLGDEVSISGKKYAVESIDRIKKDRDSLHLLRIDDKGNFLRQRDLPKKEREAEEVDEIEEEELPFGEEKEVKVKKKREITDTKRRALNLEITDNPRGEVMQYFLSGGKISPEALQELFESKKQGYRWKRLNSEERKLKRSLTKDGSPRIEELAESIAGTDRLDQTQDYRNAIEEVILNHDKVDTMAEELVNDFDIEYNAMLKEQELAEIGGEINNQIKDFVAGLPQAQKQEILDVLDTIRLEDGNIDWDTIEKELGIIDPFSEPVIQRLSEKSQKILQDAIQQFKETGRISRFRGEVVLSPEEIRAGDAARGLAEKLRAGKISKKGFRASTGFDVVFDAAIEVVATALEAGASIADAIESGLKYIRNTDWYKSIPDKKAFEDKFKNLLNEEYAIQESTAGEVPVQPEAGVSEEVEAGVPPTRPPKAPEKGEGEGRKEERRFTERLIETPGLLSAIKKGVAPTLEYIRQTNAMTVQEAEQIINVLGEDKAYSAMKSEDTKGAVRVVLGQVLIKRYNKLAKEAKTKEEKDLYIDTTIDIAEYVTVKLATEAGQTIQAFSLWDKLTPEAQLVFAARQKGKSARKNINKAKKDVDVIKEKFDKANEEAVKEILKTEEVSNTIKKDSQEGIQKAKNRAAKARQKRADIINKYKGKGGITFTTGGLTKEGIEFVGEVALTYIEEGIAEVQVIVEKVLADIKNISGKEPNETVKREVFEIADKELAKADIDMVKSVKDKKMRIDEIAIQHFTSKEKVKKELAQKFIEQADMSEGNAEALAKRFEEAFDRVVSRKKAEILSKNKKRFERVRKAVNEQAAIKAEPKTLQDEIIKYSNLGAFDTEDMLDYLSDKFKLGQLTKEQAAKIKELAEKIQTAPEGTPKREATEDLLAYQANLNGGNWGEVAQGIWYANILSGYRTHEKNVVSTFINSWVDLGAEMIADPKSAPYLIAGYIQGVKKRGLLEAGRTLATGRSPIHVAKIEVPDILERKTFIGGGYNPANWFKYVSRTMKAEDVLSFQGLKEARSYQLARKEASKLGFNTWSGSGWKKVNELLFNTTERYEIAVAQAESEGLKPNTKNWKRRVYELMENSRPTQMTEDAYNFAAHGTFNYESDGTLGAFTNAVSKALDVKVGGVQPGRFVVPFTRIITNVVNNALDYSPVGLIRVAKGARGFKSFDEISLTKGAYKPFTPEQRRIVAVKAAIGISFAAIFQYMAETGQIQISGEGPEDEKKKAQLRESGWQAYSIKIGDKWYSYQLTPLALVLGMLGNFNDAAKYGKDDEQTLLRRLNVAALKFGGMIADMTWINSAGTFLGSFVEPKISEQQRSVEKALSGMARGFVPFSQMTSQATQAYNSIFQVPAKQVNNSWEALYQDLPIARNSLNDKINALGEPVIKDIDIMVSREKADPVWKFLTEKQGWVAPLSKKTVFVFDERLRQDRPLTDNEFYELSKLRGSIIKENIKKILTEGYPVLRDGAITYVLGEDMTSAELNNILSKRIEPMATKEAKARIFGVDYSEMEKDELRAELTELEKEYWGLNDN